MLFAADATSRGTQWLFFVKMLFVVDRRRDDGAHTAAGLRRHGPNRPSSAARCAALAVVSLVAWVAAITAGRLLAYVN